MLYTTSGIVRPMMDQTPGPEATIGQRLHWIMTKRGMKAAALAKDVDLSRSAVGQWLNDTTEPTGINLSNAADALRTTPKWIATGRGNWDATTETSRVIKRTNKSEASLVERGPPQDQAGHLVLVPELDIRAKAGSGGGLIDVDDATESESTVAEYGFPSGGFRALYGAEPDRVRIIEVVGDSMEPTLFPGQKVMVDTQDRAPTPPGIFIVFDGLGLVLKRVSFVPDSDPPMVRITSDNKEYEPYQRPLGEAHIQGRVVGFWRRI